MNDKVLYVTVIGKDLEPNHDLRVENCGNSFKVTDLSAKESGETHFALNSFDFSHNSIIRMGLEGLDNLTLQLEKAEDDLKFQFYYQGGKVDTVVFTEQQYRFKPHMPVQMQVDHSKHILSPMPGAVVSVAVVPGQTVVDGQDLCVIEAMKMQNILKSERDGKVKSVQVKAGDSVTVDQLLIEFE